MNVALYMRYSSDKQTEQSIEGQERICTQFCKQNGYTIVCRYIDRATSAFKDTEKRYEFQRMIKESEKGLYEAVVVYKLDRFARNRYDSATYKARLKRNGVRVISATENISDNPEGIILESVLEGMAEFYSRELSQKITRGMYDSARKCINVGGRVPLGYRVENKHLVIDEKTAQIVREAFEKYVEGYTIADICKQFNSAGYLTSKGSEFNKNSFKSMLSNEKYAGVYTYKDIHIEGGVPAIIDRKLFDMAQSKMKSNAVAPSRFKAKVDYLLSQKLFCGECGSMMIGESGAGKSGKKYYYYKCANRKRNHACDKKPVDKELIEEAVFQETVKLITPEVIDTLADMAVQACEEDAKQNTQVPSLQAELSDIESRLGNLCKALEYGDVPQVVLGRIKELEKEKTAIQKRIDAAQAEIVHLDKAQVVFWLSQFCSGDIESPTFKRQIIDMLVNSVTVWDDGRLDITYNLKDGENKLYKPSQKGSTTDGFSPPIEIQSNTKMFVLLLHTRIPTLK